MSLLSSALSLTRLANRNLSEGDVFKVSGRLQKCFSEYLVLQGQEGEKKFVFNSKSYFDQEGQKIPPSKWKKCLHLNDCLLLKVKMVQKALVILSIHRLVLSQREPLPCPMEVFRLWHTFIREVENFFLQEGLCPVQTPSLVSCPGTEAHLRFFSTQKRLGSFQEKLWLASSPEMHLKKLLCRKATDIFEIHRSYRNEEQGPLNWNEFYMLEWYRAYAELDILIQDLENLLLHLKKQGLIQVNLKKIQTFSIQQLFKKHCSVHLTPQSSAQDLKVVLKKNQIPYAEEESFEDLFHLIFLNFIEPRLDPDTPTVTFSYPPSLRAYSKLNAEGWADRFELYWRGMELANAFNEINDPREQEGIFEEDISQHKEKELKIDCDLIAEMRAGFPPTAGIALGLERLFIASQNLKKFPIHCF